MGRSVRQKTAEEEEEGKRRNKHLTSTFYTHKALYLYYLTNPWNNLASLDNVRGFKAKSYVYL